jgi:hypothetical protein
VAYDDSLRISSGGLPECLLLLSECELAMRRRSSGISSGTVSHVPATVTSTRLPVPKEKESIYLVRYRMCRGIATLPVSGGVPTACGEILGRNDLVVAYENDISWWPLVRGAAPRWPFGVDEGVTEFDDREGLQAEHGVLTGSHGCRVLR